MAGSSYEVKPEEDIEKMDTKAIVGKIVTDEYRASTGYPFVDQKGFRESSLLFWEKLVGQSGDVLFDNYFYNLVIVWVEMLINWESRPLRHVATMVGLRIISALIQLHGKHSKKIDANNAEGAKKKQNKAGAKQHEASADKLKELEGMIEHLFNVVFVVRYRDVWHEIRGECIQALGQWILQYSSVMLETRYVKYLGWALYDPKPQVRMEAVKALTKLFENKAYLQQLDKFTARFQDRIGALPDDKDINVAVEGIKMCHTLMQAKQLSDDNINHICTLMLDKNQSIRSAAAEFALSVTFPGRSGSIVGLVEFLMEQKELTENLECVIAALYRAKRSPWLSDWEAMCNALLENDALDLEKQEILAEVLAVVAKTVSAGTNKTDKQDLTKFSTAMVSNAHKLLKRFKADVPVLRSLVGLARVMDGEQFSSQHKAANHKKVVELLGQVFTEHAEEALLRNALSSLVHLTNGKFSLAAEAKSVVDKIVDNLVKTFGQGCAAATADPDDEDAVFSVRTSLKRMAVAVAQTDLLLGPETCTQLKQIFEDARSWSTDEMRKDIFEIEAMDLFWNVSRLMRSNPVSDASLQELESKRDDVVFHLEKLLGRLKDQKGSDLGVAVVRLGSELLNVFSRYLIKNGLGKVVYTCPQSLCDMLMSVFHANHESLLVLKALVKSVEIRSVPFTCAADLLMYYGEAEGDAKEALRGVLSSLRKDAERQGKGENEYRIIFRTLKLAFERYQKSGEYDEDRSALRTLANTLVRSYGVGALSQAHKKSVVLLLQEAIPFALSLGEVGFVFLRECLIPFSSKVPQPEVLLEFFEKQKLPAGAEESAYYAYLEEFRNHLKKLVDPSSFKTPLKKKSRKSDVNPRMALQLEGEENESSARGAEEGEVASEKEVIKSATKSKRRASGRKGADNDVEEEEQEQEDDDAATSSKKKSKSPDENAESKTSRRTSRRAEPPKEDNNNVEAEVEKPKKGGRGGKKQQMLKEKEEEEQEAPTKTKQGKQKKANAETATTSTSTSATKEKRRR